MLTWLFLGAVDVEEVMLGKLQVNIAVSQNDVRSTKITVEDPFQLAHRIVRLEEDNVGLEVRGQFGDGK